jgi:hypothetical protein
LWGPKWGCRTAFHARQKRVQNETPAPIGAPGAALPAVCSANSPLRRDFAARDTTAPPGEASPSIAATQNSILTARAPAQRRRRMRFKLCLRHRVFPHLRGRGNWCAPIRTRAQRRSCMHILERMRASDSRADSQASLLICVEKRRQWRPSQCTRRQMELSENIF